MKISCFLWRIYYLKFRETAHTKTDPAAFYRSQGLYFYDRGDSGGKRMAQRKSYLFHAAIAALGLVHTHSFGQTWLSTSGSWSNAGNWTAAPTPDNATALMFPIAGAGSLAYTSTNDLPGAFTLNSVIVQGLAGGGSITLGSGGNGSLRFDGVLPSLAVTTGGNLLINSRVTVAAAVPLALAPAPGGTITFGQIIQAPTGLSIGASANGVVSLLAENRIRGVASVTGAALNLGTVDSLGGATLSVANGSLSLGSNTFAAAPDRAPYFRNHITTAAGGLILGNGRSFTFTGNIGGSGGVTIAPASLTVGTWTLAGSNTFNGPVTVNQAPGSSAGIYNMVAVTAPTGLGNASQINLNGAGAAIGFVGAATAYTINQPLQLNAGGTVGVFSRGGIADITLGGAINGTGGLTRIGDGVLTLAGSNGYTGGTTLAGGHTVVGTDAQLGNPTGAVTLGGGTLVLGPAFAGTNRNLLLGNGTAGGSLINDGSVNFTGTISNATVTPSGFTKAGLGTFVIATNAANVGSAIINNGTIHLGGVGGRLLTTGTLAINQGGALVIDHTASTTAKITGTVPISLRGAAVHVVGNATLNTSVLTGVLTLGTTSNSGQGLTTLTLEPNPARHTALRFGSLSRNGNNGMQVLFSGPGIGSSTIASVAAGQTNISFGVAPTLINGILPYAVIDQGVGVELASYSASNGVIPATYNSNTLNNGGVATHNVSIATDTIVAAGTINSAKFTGGTVNLAAGTLTVTSGAMLVTGPTTIAGGSLTVGIGTIGTIQAPTANFYIHADTNIASRLFIFGNDQGLDGGLAKSGPAVLTVSNTASIWSGPTRILQGTFRLGSNNIVGNESSVVIAAGATLDMNGFNDTMGSLSEAGVIDQVGSYLAGTVNLGSSTLILGTDSKSTSSHHNIVGAGLLVKTGAGTFTVTGSQAMTGSVTIASGTVALGTHYLTGTGFNNVSRINVGTAGTNGEVGLRLESGFETYGRPISIAAQVGRTATLAFADGAAGTLNSTIAITNAQGLIIDAASGPTLAGQISGAGPLTIRSTGLGVVDSRRYALRITGNNLHTGGTTLAGKATVFSNANALGTIGTIFLGSATGDDNPEFSGDTPLTFTRPITLQGSTTPVASYGVIGSRVPVGGGTLTFSGGVNINGSRSDLILYSNGEPLAVTGLINGIAGASVQIGHDFGGEEPTTRSNVILSGPNTYDGGTTLAAGTLGFAGNAIYAGGVITSSPIGKGTLTIGLGSFLPSHEPRLMAIGATRFVPNPIIARRDIAIGVSPPQTMLVLDGSFDIESAARRVSVDLDAIASLRGGILGTASATLLKSGAGSLLIAAPGSFAGSMVADEGVLNFNNTYALGGTLHVGATATARIEPGNAVPLVLKASGLTVDAGNGARLDIGTNATIVDYAAASPLAALTSLIASGYNGGLWNGAGIQSSSAAVNPGTAVGIIEASDTGVISFLGQSFTGDAVLLRYTLSGDSNLDGTVDLDDFTALAAGFGNDGRWFGGDFNYSGHVDLDDFTALVANFGQTIPANLPRAAVPEPSSALVLLMGALTIRRRKNQNRSMRNSLQSEAFPDCKDREYE